MEKGTRPDTLEQLNRRWHGSVDADDSPEFKVVSAVLILAAEVRDLANLLDEMGKDVTHELESIKARMPE